MVLNCSADLQNPLSGIGFSHRWETPRVFERGEPAPSTVTFRTDFSTRRVIN